MKGPSLDAIRRFKEQQERKKREEDEQKLKKKLSTLEHRAAQGDRKAKQELKKIEKVIEECNRTPEQNPPQRSSSWAAQRPQPGASKNKTATTRPPKVETDFEELMKLAKQNNNEVKKKEAPIKLVAPVPETTKKIVLPKKSKPPPQIEVYEDDYEVDDFVVDDEELDVQEEVRKTIRSVFRYDKRRCDLREEELDRQYRAIGRVSTFEDLEREERRASRLAAAEDSRALKEEEERKKLKKLRLRKS